MLDGRGLAPVELPKLPSALHEGDKVEVDGLVRAGRAGVSLDGR